MSAMLETILRQPVGRTDLESIDKHIKRLESDLDFLRAVRGVVSARLSAPDPLPPLLTQRTQLPTLRGEVATESTEATEPAAKNLPAPSQSNRGGSILDQHRERIFDFLTTHGPTPRDVIADELGIDRRVVSRIGSHAWFVKDEDVIAIATVRPT